MERASGYCRCCHGHDLTMFLPLGPQPPANAFLAEGELAAEQRFDLNTHVCLHCGLVQIPDRIPPDFFRHYLYVPSASATMHRHFGDLAARVKDTLLTSTADLLVDVGCNDGLFLKAAHDLGVRTLGIDPAENIGELARRKGLAVHGEYFTPGVAQDVAARHGRARVILSSNTVNHIDDLDAFMEGVVTLLREDGTLIVEVPRAIEYRTKWMFDNIYHEHLSVFSVKSLEALYARYDCEITHLEYIDVQGGSMRVFARRRGQGSSRSPLVAEWLAQEDELGLTEAAGYERYRERVDDIKVRLLSMIDGILAGGKTVAGYGAPAKGNTLLNYFGIGPDRLPYLVDRNELKHGLYSPGMHIPVVSPERIVHDRPDYLLVLAWNFAEEILDEQQAFRSAGGKFILPLPEPRVVA